MKLKLVSVLFFPPTFLVYFFRTWTPAFWSPMMKGQRSSTQQEVFDQRLARGKTFLLRPDSLAERASKQQLQQIKSVYCHVHSKETCFPGHNKMPNNIKSNFKIDFKKIIIIIVQNRGNFKRRHVKNTVHDCLCAFLRTITTTTCIMSK